MLLPQNETKEVAEFFYEDGKELQRIRNELKKINVSLEIIYEDVYGTAWIYHSNKGFPVKLENR